MYAPYHEMSLEQFCARMDELLSAANPETRLKRIRRAAGETLLCLARALGTTIEDLM